MDELEYMRSEVKKFIETADEKTVKMIHAMLEVEADVDWWDTMPDDIKQNVEEAIKQGERGEVLTHQEVKSKYPQWFTK